MISKLTSLSSQARFNHSIIRLLSYSIILLFITASCTERIDISTEASAPRLVIYGHITNDTMQHAIRISRSSGYFATTKPEGISHATVTISSGSQHLVLTESASEAGLYLTDPDIFGIEGETYTLNVSLDFDNDSQTEQYTASSYLPHAAPFDSVALRPSTDYKDYIEVQAFAWVSSDKDCYYNFQAFRNGEALNDSLKNFQMTDGKLIGVDKIDGVSCYFLDQTKERTKLVSGDVVTLRVDIFTREYGLFLMNAQGEAVWGAFPFSGPPANVETNIRCTGKAPAAISGFFAAYPSSKESTVW